MKKSKENPKSRLAASKRNLFIVIILLIVAPLLINVGLVITDIINDKLNITLTARGLSNENWLDFWKNYMSTAIAFLVCIWYGIHPIKIEKNRIIKKNPISI